MMLEDGGPSFECYAEAIMRMTVLLYPVSWIVWIVPATGLGGCGKNTTDDPEQILSETVLTSPVSRKTSDLILGVELASSPYPLTVRPVRAKVTSLSPC